MIERDIADVMHLVLDAPVATRERKQGRRVCLIGGEAGDGMGDLGLDLARGLANALSLDPTNLLQVWPGLAHAARITDARILGGVGERPEDAPLKAPVLGLGRGVHRDRERGAPLLPLALLPAWQGRR